VAHADREIEALLDEVDITIVEIELDRNVGISREIIGDRESEETRPARHRRAHPKHAAGRRLQIAGRALRLFHVGENAERTFVIILSDFGHADAARGAIEEPHTEPLFKRLNMGAYHCGRHAQPARRARKAAGIDDFDKYRHSAETIHAASHNDRM
jgi:hypothetical protein